MSEFPEIEPFGPHRINPPEAVELPVQTLKSAPARRSSGIALSVTAFGLGFFVAYLIFRNEEGLLGQTKLDQILDQANDWVRRQGPKFADPIRQSFETTGSSVGHAFKSTSVDDLVKRLRSSLFH